MSAKKRSCALCPVVSSGVEWCVRVKTCTDLKAWTVTAEVFVVQPLLYGDCDIDIPLTALHRVHGGDCHSDEGNGKRKSSGA